jgi:hypothetical protein
MQRIPALSLWRPWTTAITHGSKRVENRQWTTSYRGPLYLHGSQRWDACAAVLAAELGDNPAEWPEAAPGVAAVVDLVDVCTAGRTGRECDCGPWAMSGQCHWRLDNARVLSQPVFCRGKQGLWWPVGELAQELAEAAGLAVPA